MTHCTFGSSVDIFDEVHSSRIPVNEVQRVVLEESDANDFQTVRTDGNKRQ
jgi:hypothetical protein